MRHGLRLAIIALGAGLNLSIIAGPGWTTLLLILVLVVVAMALGLLLGRAARVGRTVSVLLGVGAAICGASAILAVSPLIKLGSGKPHTQSRRSLRSISSPC